MIRFAYASVAAGYSENEDYVLCSPDWSVVLDGATSPPNTDTGCAHGVAWFVRQLASSLADRLVRGGDRPLPDIVADGIGMTRHIHGTGCDLNNPDSPAATLILVRKRSTYLDYFVLADSTLVIERACGTLNAITDDRGSRLPGRKPYSYALVSRFRNKPEGFWVAGTDPAAGYNGIFGRVEIPQIRSAGIFTDGVTRLNDWFGYSWEQIFALLHQRGPSYLIKLVRAEEIASDLVITKLHDDATAVFMESIKE